MILSNGMFMKTGGLHFLRWNTFFTNFSLPSKFNKFWLSFRGLHLGWKRCDMTNNGTETELRPTPGSGPVSEVLIGLSPRSVKALLFSIHIKKVTGWTNRALRVARWLHQSGILEGRPLDRKSGGGKKRNTFLPTHGKAELRSTANTCCSLGADCRSPVGRVSDMWGFHSTCFGQQRSREVEIETRLTDKQTDSQLNLKLWISSQSD